MTLNFSISYCHNNQEIAMERFDDGPVMINFLTGRYFSLNAWADWVWQCFSHGCAPHELIIIMADLPVIQAATGSSWKEDIQHFLSCLIEQRLLAQQEHSVAITSVQIESLISKVPPEYISPRLEIFDDLADLILLDPIHDVNQSLGWPVAQKSDTPPTN